jgi:oligopeptidase A
MSSTTAAADITTNPLLDSSGLPKFSSIEPSNLTPAVSSLLEKLDKDFADLTSKISSESYQPKYEEILPELEKMQYDLGFAWGVTSHLNGVKNSDELRQAYEENQPKVVKAMAQFSQSREVYDALTEIRSSLGDASADDFELSQKIRALDGSLRGMKLGGVGLDGVEKERFNEIRLRLAELGTSFSNNVLDATKAYSLIVEDPSDVANVPESAKAMWANAYKASLGEDGEKMEVDSEKGPWKITLDMPSYIATMTHIQAVALGNKFTKLTLQEHLKRLSLKMESLRIMYLQFMKH